MPRKNTTSKTAAAQRRRAETIIKAKDKYSATVRELVSETLKDNPSQLPRVFAAIDQFEKRTEEFGRGLYAFASTAYSNALRFYAEHYDNPEALAAFDERTGDRASLAEAISEILNNPTTPVGLRESVGDFVCDISGQLNDDSPEFIANALAFGNCGYDNCPGTTDGSTCPGTTAHPTNKRRR